MITELNRYSPTIEQGVLKTLSYFDVFKYPLNAKEVHNFCPCDCTFESIQDTLSELSDDEVISSEQGYYGLTINDKRLEHRLQANALAEQTMPEAIVMANFIRRFPFVRSVSISGSLSKNVMHKDSDIDYFIITEKNRLWIAKLFLVLYKRVFLFNNKEKFCINYFISLEDLNIDERNVFTATELATLIPINGKIWVRELLEKNSWINNYLPQLHKNFASNTTEENHKRSWLEIALGGFVGDIVDRCINKLVSVRNKLRYLRHKGAHFELMFRSTRNQSKVHTSNHQTKILEMYQHRLANINSELKVAVPTQ